MMTILIMVSVGLGVAALIGGLAITLRSSAHGSVVEDRLSALTAQAAREKEKNVPSILSGNLDDAGNLADQILSRLGNIKRLMDQADVSMTASKFLTLCGISAALGIGICLVSPTSKLMAPLFGVVASSVPLLWLLLRRRNRIRKFSEQLPEALELLSRSLRAGHSLGSGFNLIATEMQNPIAQEFSHAYEEQNLGIPLDEALEAMTDRIPNLDLRFFATAVTLQRQTGGDLAEILDKIGRLIRERFKLAGQIQALTGEGRLSGIVLLALPPILFVVMYNLNYEYSMVLLRDPTGRKLLGAALVLQFIGALVIRKIISIKV